MTLTRDLQRFVEDTGDKTYPAMLGRKENGGWVINTPGQLGGVWITTGGQSGFGGGFMVAYGYTGGTPGQPIRYKIRNGKAWIVGADTDQLPIYTGGGTTIIEGTSVHSHAIGSGNVDPVEGLRIVPGLVRPLKVGGAYGLQVWIEPFAYAYGGDIRWWPGQAFDLTSYLPGTASTQAWVIVGIDPTDNTATASTGTEYTLAANMTPALIDETSFTGLALSAIVLQNGQTAINSLKKFVDLRGYANVDASGAVGGSTGSTDNAILRADGTGGTTIQSTGVTIDDNDRLTLPDSGTYPPLNVTERSAAPSSPSSGDIYLDDGTNTASGDPGWRRYTGSAWEDVSAGAGGSGGYTEGVRVYNSSNLTISDSTVTSLTFNSENYDSDGIHSTSSNTGRLTCQTAGKYIVWGMVMWATNSAGSRFLRLKVNGATDIGEVRMPPLSTEETQQVIMTEYDLSVSDYVEIQVYQTSGSPVNIQADGAHSPTFGMRRVA